MKTPIAHRFARFAILLAALSILGGCAVYDPGPAYYGNHGGVIYAQPPAHFARPAYVAPPAFYFDFQPRSRGYHHGHYRGRHRGRGWR